MSDDDMYYEEFHLNKLQAMELKENKTMNHTPKRMYTMQITSDGGKTFRKYTVTKKENKTMNTRPVHVKGQPKRYTWFKIMEWLVKRLKVS